MLDCTQLLRIKFISNFRSILYKFCDDVVKNCSKFQNKIYGGITNGKGNCKMV